MVYFRFCYEIVDERNPDEFHFWRQGVVDLFLLGDWLRGPKRSYHLMPKGKNISEKLILESMGKYAFISMVFSPNTDVCIVSGSMSAAAPGDSVFFVCLIIILLFFWFHAIFLNSLCSIQLLASHRTTIFLLFIWVLSFLDSNKGFPLLFFLSPKGHIFFSVAHQSSHVFYKWKTSVLRRWCPHTTLHEITNPGSQVSQFPRLHDLFACF